MSGITDKQTSLQCYHCGDSCQADTIAFDDKHFCCAGCKSVYEILSANQLCTYYSLTEHPGISQSGDQVPAYYDFLDKKEVQDSLIHFREGTHCHAEFVLPHMHCSSCIWLLENLHRMHDGVISARVRFLEKTIQVVFDAEKISLKAVVVLLKKIGYEPQLNAESLGPKTEKKLFRSEIYKIGIAGFCFGNIMMLSLPDYFSDGNFFNEKYLNHVFNYLSLALSLPVLIYSAREFFVSSFQNLKQRQINIDVPITLAIVVAFVTSVYLIVFESRMGYLDSMSGIVFFMLLGRFFQNRSYKYLTFKRNIASYLPIAVNKWVDGKEESIPVTDLEIGDDIRVRQQEIVATDSILLSEQAWFDYSFVTGESHWVEKHRNELIYAGAIQKSGLTEMRISKKPNQSYVTQLWNSQQQDKFKNNTLFTTEWISFWFSVVVLLIGTAACAFWMFRGEYQIGLTALMTVWIIACPCALLLCSTFTYGNMLTILSANGCFVKNAAVLERMRNIDTMVFDKTGTLTSTRESSVDFIGRTVKGYEWEALGALANLSIHPLSCAVSQYIGKVSKTEISDFVYHEGQGIAGRCGNLQIRLGSQQWMGLKRNIAQEHASVFAEINGEVLGYFEIRNQYRPGILVMLLEVKKQQDIYLLSGDADAERKNLMPVFGESHLFFNQLPEQKTNQIEAWQSTGNTVMMLGDGLNDANAFSKSDVGVAVIENQHHFLPPCDVILEAKGLKNLPALMKYVRQGRTTLLLAFTFSVMYNLIGLYFAVQGMLTPVVAAILMPISTVSIVGISFFMSRYFAKQQNLQI